MKQRFAVLLILVVILSSLMGGLLGGDVAAKSASSNAISPNEFLTNFTEALDVIQKTYVDKVGPDKLVYSAIKGMLRGLDPHSSFFDPKEFSRLREDQHSKYFRTWNSGSSAPARSRAACHCGSACHRHSCRAQRIARG